MRTRRTIPTGVGKIAPVLRETNEKKDHPHGRGENLPPPICGLTLRGPSPRAWGKSAMTETTNPSLRTIPTGVGKIARHFPPETGMLDHPHGRGENGTKFLFVQVVRGPSPRAWGK